MACSLRCRPQNEKNLLEREKSSSYFANYHRFGIYGISENNQNLLGPFIKWGRLVERKNSSTRQPPKQKHVFPVDSGRYKSTRRYFRRDSRITGITPRFSKNAKWAIRIKNSKREIRRRASSAGKQINQVKRKERWSVYLKHKLGKTTLLFPARKLVFTN